MTNLQKAESLQDQCNWTQALHHADLAANKLKQLKDDRLKEAIGDALRVKNNALNSLGRYKEGLECAKEHYCMYLTSHTHPPAIEASFALIQCCIFNKEYADAEVYARTLWETINDKTPNNKIPIAQRPPYIARGASVLARSILRIAQTEGYPPEVVKNREVEAIALARQALEIDIQLLGADNDQIAFDMGILAQVLSGFGVADDEEVLRLLQESMDIHVRKHGRTSPNVAAGENSLGNTYSRRANKALKAKDRDRQITNLELALPHYREAARIYRAVDHLDDLERVTQNMAQIEKLLNLYRTKSTKS